MEGKRGKKQGASAQAAPSAKTQFGRGEANRTGVHAEAIFRYLAENPDVDGLMREYPQLTADDLRAYFAEARSLVQETATVSFRKGASRTVFARTHGLPEPDLSIHKGNIFRALVSLLKPGRMLISEPERATFRFLRPSWAGR